MLVFIQVIRGKISCCQVAFEDKNADSGVAIPTQLVPPQVCAAGELVDMNYQMVDAHTVTIVQ